MGRLSVNVHHLIGSSVLLFPSGWSVTIKNELGSMVCMQRINRNKDGICSMTIQLSLYFMILLLFPLISSVEFIHFLGHILIIIYILKLKKTLNVSEFMLCNDSHNLMSSVYLDIGFRIPTSACSCYNLQTFMSRL